MLGPGEAETYDDVARIAGIEPLNKAWVEIGRPEARARLTGHRHRSLAYQTELMPFHRADWLAGEFIDAFGPYSTEVSNVGLRPSRPAGVTAALGRGPRASLSEQLTEIRFPL
jgi:hypothetical protein